MSNNSLIHVNIRITGRVQFVGFRAGTHRAALEFGIKGVVMNMADGSVYVEAEGDNNALSLFTAWCKTGTPWSKVDEVEIAEGPWVGYEDFRIVRGER